MRKYASQTCFAFNVMIGGKRKHISFEPVTSGGSIFQTSDKEVQEAMEKSSCFNKLFKLIEIKEQKSVEAGDNTGEELNEGDGKGNVGTMGITASDLNIISSSKTDGDNDGNHENTFAGENVTSTIGSGGLQEISEITNPADAKAFLKEKGAKASALTSKEKIRSAATDLGFSFPNL